MLLFLGYTILDLVQYLYINVDRFPYCSENEFTFLFSFVHIQSKQSLEDFEKTVKKMT